MKIEVVEAVENTQNTCLGLGEWGGGAFGIGKLRFNVYVLWCWKKTWVGGRPYYHSLVTAISRDR